MSSQSQLSSAEVEMLNSGVHAGPPFSSENGTFMTPL